jgi:hypothetical protein
MTRNTFLASAWAGLLAAVGGWEGAVRTRRCFPGNNGNYIFDSPRVKGDALLQARRR